MQAEDLPLSAGINGDCDYRRHGDNAPTLTHLQIDGIQPQI